MPNTARCQNFFIDAAKSAFYSALATDTHAAMVSLGFNSPCLFAASYPCSPSVCADVHATARSRLEEGDVDGLVRSRFSDGERPLQPLATGSRLLRQVAEVCTLTGEKEPLTAMSAMMRELKELREVKERVLQGTGQPSVDAAMSVIEVAMRDRAELRTAEDALGASLGADGWRAVAAEVESGRHLEQRIRAFAGVASGSTTSLEAALRTLHHRERERLSLIQLRNDVLTVAGAAKEKGATGGDGGAAAALATKSGEPTAVAVRLVSELVEAGNAIKAAARRPSLTEAVAVLNQPTAAESELLMARRRLRRIHHQMMIAARSLPHALHKQYIGDLPPPQPAAHSLASAPAANSGERSARSGMYSERDFLVDGEEDTDDDEESGPQWRAKTAGGAADEQTTASTDGSMGMAPTAAGVHIPRLPLSQAAAPGTSDPSQHSAASSHRKKGNSSARPASPRRAKAGKEGGESGTATVTSSSSEVTPRGSPSASKVSARAPGGKGRRPPTAPLSLSSLSQGNAQNGGGGCVVVDGLGSGLTTAWSRDYVPTALVGIGARTLVHEAHKVGGLASMSSGAGDDGPRATALCALVLEESSWENAREELKALGTLEHPSIMRIHGWYERRLPTTLTRVAPSYEVSVAAQLYLAVICYSVRAHSGIPRMRSSRLLQRWRRLWRRLTRYKSVTLTLRRGLCSIQHPPRRPFTLALY